MKQSMCKNKQPLILNVGCDGQERTAMTRVLRQAGYEVLETATGEEALRLAAGGAHVLLLDTTLPGLDSGDVHREIRTNACTAAIRIVEVCPREAGVDDRMAALGRGAEACLTPPVDPVTLLGTVGMCVRLKEAEVAVREHESTYRTIVQSAADGILCAKAEGSFADVNDSACAMLGYTREELLGGQGIADVIAAEEIARVGAEIARLRPGEVLRSEWLLRRKDGTLFPGEVVATVLADGRLTGIVRDITERRQIEELRRERESALIEAERIARTGTWTWTPATGAISWSDGVNRILRRHPDLAPPTFDTLARFYTAESWDRLMAARARVSATGRLDEVDVEMIRADGTTCWTTTRGELVCGPDGAMLAIRGTIQEIDEPGRADRAVQEERTYNRAIVDSMPGLFYLIDERGRILQWNRNFEKVSGYTAEEISRMSVPDFFGESQRGLVVQRVQEVFSSGEVVVEASFVAKDGTATPHLFSGKRILFDGRSCVVGLGVDITARKQAEDDLRTREARYLRQRNALISLTQSEALSGADLSAALQRITEVAANTLAVARASIWRYSSDRTRIECADMYEREANRHSSGVELCSSAYPAYFDALAEGSIMAVEDAHRDRRTSEFSESYLTPLGITSMMDAPISLRGEVAGVLCHEHVGLPSLREWTPDESAFAVAMANLVSLVLEGVERRQVEEWLRNSETRHRALFEGTADANILMDGNSFMDCNAAALRMFGFASRSEMISLHPLDISPSHQPDGTPSRLVADQRMAAVLREGTGRFEWSHRRRNGEVFPTDVCLTILTLGDGPTVLATIRDITERVRAEAEVRLQSAALNAAADAIAITDRDGNIVWVNRSFCALTGYGEDEVIGKTPGKLLKSGEHTPSFYKGLWETILSGGVWRGEMTNRHKDGSLYHESMVITPVTNAGGDITHFIAIKRDLTEQRRLQAQFLQAQRMEAVGTLAGGIAHDFNNILGAILGCTEMAAMDAAGNQEVLKNLAQVTAAGHRATELVRRILAFSGQQEQFRQSMHLNAVVGEALALLRASLPASVELRSTFDPDAPAVLADSTQVHQIVMNLGVNAWHALGDRPGLIEVTLDTVDAKGTLPPPHAGRYVRLSVRDTGHGMDAATQARIFEPFFTTKGPGEGTGLGLSTVHGIMKSYDGEITVFSRPGRGATFQLYFPEVDAGITISNTDEAPMSRGHGQHILFVDDEVALVGWGAQALKRLGYRVTGHSSVTEAFAAVRQHADSFDLVITDLTMPEMTGLELARGVHAIRADLPFILTTGNGSATTGEATRELGIRAFLSKPIGLKVLADTVRLVLEGK